jgi:hypothetical protein
MITVVKINEQKLIEYISMYITCTHSVDVTNKEGPFIKGKSNVTIITRNLIRHSHAYKSTLIVCCFSENKSYFALLIFHQKVSLT